MTVHAKTFAVEYLGNGKGRVFAVPFPFIEAADLAVELTVDGVTTELLLDTDYTVVDEAVVLPAPLARRAVLSIERDLELTQPFDLAGEYTPELLELALDRVTMLSQQVAASVAGPAMTRTAAPVLDALVSPTKADPISFGGSAAAGAVVRIKANGVTIGQVTADAQGFFASVSGLAAGTFVITATARAPGELESEPSTPQTLVVQGASIPTVSAPGTGGATASPTNAATITIPGTADPGATVRVYNGTTLLGSAVAAGDGTWSLTQALAEGTYSIRATAQLGSRPVSGYSTTRTWVVDRTGVTGITLPAQASTVPEGDLLVTGTCEAGATNLEYFITGGTWTAAPSPTIVGTSYSFTLTGLTAGAKQLWVRSTDPAGNVGTSGGRSFTVSAGVSAQPAISTPAASAYTNAEPIVVTGTGVVGATVDGSIGAITDTDTVDVNGAWSMSFAAVPEGARTISVTQTEGGKTVSAAVTRAITVDRTAPAQPVIGSPANGANLVAGTYAVAVNLHSEVATLRIYVDAVEAAVSPAPVTGAQSLNVTLSPGTRVLTAKLTDRAGNESALSAAVTVTVTGTQTAAPTLTQPTTPTNATTVTLTGTAVYPSNVYAYIGGVATGQWAATQANGSYSIAGVPLGVEGSKAITTRAEAPGYTRSVDSTTRTVVVDRTAPSAPAITFPATEEWVTSTSQTIVGTGEVGATVTVYFGAQSATATVDGSGNWTRAVTFPSTGQFGVYATQRDAAGNVSAASPTALIVVTPAPETGKYLAWNAAGTALVNLTPAEILDKIAGPAPVAGERYWIDNT